MLWLARQSLVRIFPQRNHLLWPRPTIIQTNSAFQSQQYRHSLYFRRYKWHYVDWKQQRHLPNRPGHKTNHQTHKYSWKFNTESHCRRTGQNLDWNFWERTVPIHCRAETDCYVQYSKRLCFQYHQFHLWRPKAPDMDSNGRRFSLFSAQFYVRIPSIPTGKRTRQYPHTRHYRRQLRKHLVQHQQ